MAPVVRAEPNGSQALLTFDGAYADLEEFGWLSFIRKFYGFNIPVARQFALSFDGCRAKIGDLQIEVTEHSLSLETGLPVKEKKWSKSFKVKRCPMDFVVSFSDSEVVQHRITCEYAKTPLAYSIDDPQAVCNV
jgi:hypothetical protein